MWKTGVVAALGEHQAGTRLEDRIEARQAGERSRRAVAADRGVDQARILGRQPVPADAEPFHDPAAKVVDHDVGGAREVEKNVAPLDPLEIEHERALAAVPADEGKGRHSEGIAFCGLDLHHVGTEVSQEERAEWARDVARQVEDAHPREAARGRRGDARGSSAHAACSLGARRPVSAPRSDAGRGAGAGVSEKSAGSAGCHVGPRTGSSSPITSPSARASASASASSRVRTGPQGMSASRSRASHSAVVRAAKMGSSAARTKAFVSGAPKGEGMSLEARIDEQVHALDERHELHPERLRESADEEPSVARAVDAVVRVDAARVSAREERAVLARSAHVGAAAEGECAADGVSPRRAVPALPAHGPGAPP